jgi:hypothetical protein
LVHAERTCYDGIETPRNLGPRWVKRRAQCAFADIVWRAKCIYSRTAAPEMLEELAERGQFVITAIGA